MCTACFSCISRLRWMSVCELGALGLRFLVFFWLFFTSFLRSFGERWFLHNFEKFVRPLGWRNESHFVRNLRPCWWGFNYRFWHHLFSMIWYWSHRGDSRRFWWRNNRTRRYRKFRLPSLTELSDLKPRWLLPRNLLSLLYLTWRFFTNRVIFLVTKSRFLYPALTA
jgi:hypothetical protein